MRYHDCYSIIKNTVYPERQKLKDKGYKEKWWQFGRRAVDLYFTIEPLDKVLVIARTSKTLAFDLVPKDQVYSANLTVIAKSSDLDLLLYQSVIHNVWIWKYCTTMKTDPIYQPEDVFQTFPAPKSLSNVYDNLAKTFIAKRKNLLKKMVVGLTKTYNAFHAKEIQPTLTTARLANLSPKEIEKQYSKEVLNLWNHLQKTEGTCTWEEAVAGIVELRSLHKQMDEAVLEAYGWCFDTAQQPAINLAHDFYEVDYLPENDRVRYTISPAARKEVLKRLLLLNHERYEQEIQQGLHKQADVEAFYAQKGMAVPAGTPFCDKKGATYKVPAKAKKVEEDKGEYGMGRLF